MLQARERTVRVWVGYGGAQSPSPGDAGRSSFFWVPPDWSLWGQGPVSMWVNIGFEFRLYIYVTSILSICLAQIGQPLFCMWSLAPEYLEGKISWKRLLVTCGAVLGRFWNPIHSSAEQLIFEILVVRQCGLRASGEATDEWYLGS